MKKINTFTVELLKKIRVVPLKNYLSKFLSELCLRIGCLNLNRQINRAISFNFRVQGQISDDPPFFEKI